MDEAEVHLREAIAVKGIPSGLRAWIGHNLAEVLVAGDQLDVAQTVARQALATLREAGTPAWRIADAESILALVLIHRGDFREAEDLLLRAYPVLVGLANTDPDNRYFRKVLDHLIALYEAWGRPERAELYRNIRDGEPGAGGPRIPELASPEISATPFELDLY